MVTVSWSFRQYLFLSKVVWPVFLALLLSMSWFVDEQQQQEQKAHIVEFRLFCWGWGLSLFIVARVSFPYVMKPFFVGTNQVFTVSFVISVWRICTTERALLLSYLTSKGDCFTFLTKINWIIYTTRHVSPVCFWHLTWHFFLPGGNISIHIYEAFCH